MIGVCPCVTYTLQNPGDLTRASALVQLKIVTWKGQEKASEAISDLETSEEAPVFLSAFYPAQTSVPIPERQAPPAAKAEFKWWPDGYEPMYYVVTGQVRRQLFQAQLRGDAL